MRHKSTFQYLKRKNYQFLMNIIIFISVLGLTEIICFVASFPFSILPEAANFLDNSKFRWHNLNLFIKFYCLIWDGVHAVSNLPIVFFIRTSIFTENRFSFVVAVESRSIFNGWAFFFVFKKFEFQINEINNKIAIPKSLIIQWPTGPCHIQCMTQGCPLSSETIFVFA